MALAANAAYRLLQAKAPVAPLRANFNPTMTTPAMAQASAYGSVKPSTAPGAPAGTPAPTAPATQAAAVGGVGGVLPTSMPGEGIYAQDSAGAYDAYNAAMTAAEKESSNAKLQYGFNADGSNLDPSNSTGIMQQLMHKQSQASMQGAENALGRNLGGAGLGAQVAEENDFQNQADLANATQGYQGLLAAALAHKGDANTTLTNALIAARQRQIQLDIQNQMFNAFMAQNSGAGGDGGSGNDNAPSVPAALLPFAETPGDTYSAYARPTVGLTKKGNTARFV